MPRLVNVNPTYRLHKSSGCDVVTLNGEDVYLGDHCSAASKREYDRVIVEWLARGRQRRGVFVPWPGSRRGWVRSWKSRHGRYSAGSRNPK